ncbi:hypothetical protein D3C81_1054990 [compost metagenome]
MVGDGRGVDPGAIGDGDAPVRCGLQVDVFIAGANHADDLEVGQGGDFIGIQPQRATGEDGVDLPGVVGNGFGALGGRRGQDQVKALMFEDRQVLIDGFNQYQNGYRHAWLPVGIEKSARTSLEIADFRAAWQPPAIAVRGSSCAIVDTALSVGAGNACDLLLRGGGRFTSTA